MGHALNRSTPGHARLAGRTGAILRGHGGGSNFGLQREGRTAFWQLFWIEVSILLGYQGPPVLPLSSPIGEEPDDCRMHGFRGPHRQQKLSSVAGPSSISGPRRTYFSLFRSTTVACARAVPDQVRADRADDRREDAGYLTSIQVVPNADSTVSGTTRSMACSMCSATKTRTGSACDSGASKTSSSWICRSIRTSG